MYVRDARKKELFLNWFFFPAFIFKKIGPVFEVGNKNHSLNANQKNLNNYINHDFGRNSTIAFEPSKVFWIEEILNHWVYPDAMVVFF